MALIPVYFVVADYYAADPDFTTDLQAGTLVRLTAAGLAAPATATTAIGIAGDTQSNDHPGTAYAAGLVIGANGAQTRWTQNRVSDFYNETLASGQMTVYHSGGKFRTDRVADGITFAVGEVVYSDANGLFTNVNGGGARAVGIVTGALAAYPSGVPGTDTTDGSLSLGTFLTVKLSI